LAGFEVTAYGRFWVTAEGFDAIKNVWIFLLPS
jgi:hypothetical protein